MKFIGFLIDLRKHEGEIMIEINEEELDIENFLEEFRKFQWFLEEFRIQFPKQSIYNLEQKERARKILDIIIDETFISDLQLLEFVVDSLDNLTEEYYGLFN